MPKSTGPLLVACCLGWGLLAHAADPPSPVGPERLARHALGRAHAAEQRSACLATKAAALKAVGEALLDERDPHEQTALKAELAAAHQALTRCLAPLPPAEVSGPPDRVPGTELHVQVLKMEPGAGKVALQRWVEGAQRQLLACYLPAAARDPLLSGKATFKLIWGPGARVPGARLLSTSLANLSVAQCAARQLADLGITPDLGPKGQATVRLVFARCI